MARNKARDCESQGCNKRTEHESGLCKNHRLYDWCHFPGCLSRGVYGMRYCSGHDSQWREGKTLKPITRNLGRRRPKDMPAMEWFASFIGVTEEEPTCWLWAGQKSSRGYGRFSHEGRLVDPHRWIIEKLVKPIPEGHQVDHLCQQHLCVNPAHLQVVSREAHQQVTNDRARLLRGVASLPGVEGIALLGWRASPWSKLPTLAALEFAQVHELPYFIAGGWRNLGIRNAPRHVEDRQREARLQQARAEWLEQHGHSEESYAGGQFT